MTRKNLILLYRGPEYHQDFEEIADKVHALDPDITVFFLFAGLDAALPDAEWEHPTLTIALCSEFKLPVRRGPILRNHLIDKLDQQDILRRNNILTPNAMAFEFGMKLDPLLFGNFVVLKPRDPLLNSHGYGVMVMRRERAQAFRPTELPNEHPLLWNRKGYVVQRFIETGPRPTSSRVSMFLGSVLYAITSVSTNTPPSLEAPDHVIEKSDFTQKHDREIIVGVEAKHIELAKRVAATFGHIPLLGVDIIEDARTGKPYVLEVNAGGNTWHFSSRMWAPIRRDNPELVPTLKETFSSFDNAARALVATVHELAA